MLSRYFKHKKSYVAYRKKNRNKIKNMIKKCVNKNRFGGNRQLALDRDNYECQFCGMTQEQHMVLFGCNLTIDHIDGKGRNNEEKNHNLDNLQTLCLRCHGKKDKLKALAERSC